LENNNKRKNIFNIFDVFINLKIILMLNVLLSVNTAHFHKLKGGYINQYNFWGEFWNMNVLYFWHSKSHLYSRFVKVFVKGLFSGKKNSENSLQNHTTYLYAPICLTVVNSYRKFAKLGIEWKSWWNPVTKLSKTMTHNL
jgi:hypothetical protein